MVWRNQRNHSSRAHGPHDAEQVGDRFRAVESIRDQTSPDESRHYSDGICARIGASDLRLNRWGIPATSFTEEAQYQLSEVGGTTRVSSKRRRRFTGRLSQSFEPFITSASKKKFQHDLERLKALVEAGSCKQSTSFENSYVRSGDAFKNSRRAHPAANAHRDQSVALVAALELPQN
jgi:hypothetical protein